MTTPDIITTGDAGRILGRSVRTVQRLIEVGDLPVVGKLSGTVGHFLLDRAVVEELARTRAAKAEAERLRKVELARRGRLPITIPDSEETPGAA